MVPHYICTIICSRQNKYSCEHFYVTVGCMILKIQQLLKIHLHHVLNTFTVDSIFFLITYIWRKPDSWVIYILFNINGPFLLFSSLMGKISHNHDRVNNSANIINTPNTYFRSNGTVFFFFLQEVGREWFKSVFLKYF